MAGASYDALMNKKQNLIRKARKGSVFAAPTSASQINTLTDPTDKLLTALPAGWFDLGWISDDGAQFSSNIDTSDVSSWGSVTPTRTDITQESTELQIACQETNLHTIGLYVGVATTGVTPAANGEVKILKPLQPVKQTYHLLNLAVDENEAGEIYMARYFPNAEVTDKDDQSMSSGDDPLLWPVTFSARPDTVYGCAEAWLFGGPGWNAILSDMGLGPATPQGLTVGTITSTSVVLTWTAVAGATSYLVQRSTDGGTTWTLQGSGAGGAPSTANTTVTGLTTATAYKFRVATVAGGITGSYSNAVSATTS
jgi:hypothetical protein